MTGTARHPVLAPEVRMTSPRYRGARAVHLVSDPRTGRCYELGPREHFAASRLDGTRSLDEIGAEYRLEFGRAPGEAGWRQLLGLLHSRNLLARPDGDTAPAVLREPVTARRSDYRAGRWVIASTSTLVDSLYRRIRLLFHGAVQAAVAVVLMLLLVVVAGITPDARADLRALWQPVPALLVLAGLCVSMSLHERAHGLAARHHGADAPEIGVLYRIPMIMFYCRVDGAAIVTDRRARIAVAVAGVWANLVALLPVLLWWSLTTGDLHRTLGGALLVGTAAGLVNLVPLKPLDGYVLVSEITGTLDLAGGASDCVRHTLRRLRGRTSVAYPARLRATYLGYLGLAAGAVAVAVGVLAAFCLHVLPRPWGPNLLAIVLIGSFAAVAARLVAERPRPHDHSTH